MTAAGSLAVCDKIDALGVTGEQSGLFPSTQVGDGKDSDKQRGQHQQAENPSKQADKCNPGTRCLARSVLIRNCDAVFAGVLHGAHSSKWRPPTRHEPTPVIGSRFGAI